MLQIRDAAPYVLHEDCLCLFLPGGDSPEPRLPETRCPCVQYNKRAEFTIADCAVGRQSLDMSVEDADHTF